MTKGRMSLLAIWNMCFGFFGIQIGFGLQNANASRIFQTLGAEIEQLPILWIAAPATGLLVQPIIGYFSDKTWGKMGRRRPYFFWGAILTTLALIAMPNSPSLWIAAGLLWIMDASINITMEPFRAFVGDQLPDEQRTQGYAMQSLFIGVGAVLSSALPWILSNVFAVASTAPTGIIPDSVKWSFYIGGAGLLLAVLWTVFTTKEYSPDELAAFERAEAENNAGESLRDKIIAPGLGRFYGLGLGLLLAGSALCFAVFSQGLEKELYVLGGGLVVFGLCLIAAGLMKQNSKEKGAFFEIVADTISMPKTMRQLAVVQFFSWFALFAMWIYTTSAVTAFHYNTTDPTSVAYNEGANWVGILFAIYNGVAVIAALLIPPLSRLITRKGTHALCLVLGALGFAGMVHLPDPTLLWIPMIGIGFAWAAILSIPYAILSGTLPSAKMGIYMGVFNFFIVIPQLVAASILGAMLKSFFNGQAFYALAIGGLSLLLAAVAVLFVQDKAEKAARQGAKA
ncbi:MAG: MFS transporter [Asticcacaulis sp.]